MKNEYDFSDIKELKYEDALRELQEITKKIEGGDAKLSEVTYLFKRGIALQTHCQSFLDDLKMIIEEIKQ
jgi:exodeoxyribonuclease VII small subunit